MASASNSKSLPNNTGYSATLTASFDETSTSTANNTSTISVSATQKTGNFDWSSSYTSQLKIYWYDNNENSDGTLVDTTGATSQGRNATISASGTITVKHKTDGSLSGYARAVWTKNGNSNWTPNSGEVSTANTALTKIPRYATVSQSLSAKTETSITMNWSSDSTIDYIWYSINNGSSWTGINVADGKSGSYTIDGLTANTTYQIKTRVRRKDSQLTTNSSTLSVATYAYPYASSMPNFTIGDRLTLGIYNPLGRSVTVNILGADDSQISNDTTTGTSISGYNGQVVVDRLYNSIPNSKTGTYKVKVTYGSQISTKTGGTYTVNPADCLPAIGTATYQDTNAATVAVTENNQNIVENLSTVSYTASGLTAQKGATVSAVSVSVNGNSYDLTLNAGGTSATGGNAVINSAYDVTATFTVVDSRGITATKEITVNILEWVLPNAIITLRRHNNYYTATDITVDANYSSVDGKNTIDIKYRSKKVSDSDYGAYASLSDDVTGTFNADNEYAWDVQVVLTDALGGTVTYNLLLARGMPIMFIDRILNSIGFSCFPKGEKTVELNGFDITRSVATRSLSAQITNLSVNTYTKIELDLDNVTGSKLTTNEYGEIVVGTGVSKVLVSGAIAFEAVTIGGNRHARIVKNSYTAANTLGWVWDTFEVADADSLIIPPQLVNVSPGDKIGLYYYTPQSADRIGGNAYGGRTSLTVEVVA